MTEQDEELKAIIKEIIDLQKQNLTQIQEFEAAAFDFAEQIRLCKSELIFQDEWISKMLNN